MHLLCTQNAVQRYYFFLTYANLFYKLHELLTHNAGFSAFCQNRLQNYLLKLTPEVSAQEKMQKK